MNLAVISASIACSSVIQFDRMAPPQVPHQRLARVQLCIEQPEPMTQRLGIRDAVEMFEQEGQRLTFVQTRLTGEFL